MKQLRADPKQRGLTLVELMIAMALSLLLMVAATSMFLSSKKTFKVQEESARIQENMRYVVTRMITDLSPAGFYGCAPSAQSGASQIYSTVTSASNNPLYNFSEAITGEDGGDTPEEGDGPSNSDSLTVRFARPEISLPVIAPMTASDSPVHVDSEHPAYDELSQGDIIAVSDCSHLAVFMISNEPGDNGQLGHEAGTGDVTNNTADETTHYFGGEPHSTATIIKMDAVTYDLGITIDDKDTETTEDDTTTSSLYATRLVGGRQEILSGVENFQVSYGIDTTGINSTDPLDGTSDRYIDWDEVTEELKGRIASLRITLTINSGKPIPGTDGISPGFKETIEFVVKLRNRLTDL